MKKIQIIKKNDEFAEIIKLNKKTINANLIVYYRLNNTFNRYGISIPTKLGNAVVRNKNKRQIKNIIDIMKKDIPNSYDYVIIVRKGMIALTFKEKRDIIYKTLLKIGANK